MSVFHPEKWRIFEEIIKYASEGYVDGQLEHPVLERVNEIIGKHGFLGLKKWWDYDE